MNKNTNSSLLFAILLVVSIFMGGLPTVGQEPTDALRRGYRAGYTDGYMSGYKDISEGLSREIRRHSEYSTADRTYTAEFGKLEDFQDGYRQGFEKGYAHGFERKPFDSSLPTGLSRRGNVEPSMAVVATVPPPTPASPDEDEEEGVEEEFEEEEVEEEESKKRSRKKRSRKKSPPRYRLRRLNRRLARPPRSDHPQRLCRHQLFSRPRLPLRNSESL